MSAQAGVILAAAIVGLGGVLTSLLLSVGLRKQLAIFHDDAANEEISVGIGENNYDSRFTMDRWFRPDASHMATGVEGNKGENVREVHMNPGERWNEDKYREMNLRYQRQAMEHLRRLAGDPGAERGAAERSTQPIRALRW